MTQMADQAGIINRGGPKDDRAFAQIAADAEPEIQELAYAVRSLVYDVLPQTVEVVWPKQGRLDRALGRRSSANSESVTESDDRWPIVQIFDGKRRSMVPVVRLLAAVMHPARDEF
jgi:hypothetical protein